MATVRVPVVTPIFNDFYKVMMGSLLIPAALAVNSLEFSVMPFLTLKDLLLLASILVNGLPIILNAVKGVVHRQVNVDELVSIAVIACVINGNCVDGFLMIQARKVGQDSTLGKIIQLVNATEQSKTRSSKLVDQYAA